MERRWTAWPDDLAVRRLLTWWIVRAGRVVTVAELATAVEGLGLRPPGRTSKEVSDRLRADVARGRLRRVGRGRYVAGTIAPTTWRRIEAGARETVRQARADHIVSAVLGDGAVTTCRSSRDSSEAIGRAVTADGRDRP